MNIRYGGWKLVAGLGINDATYHVTTVDKGNGKTGMCPYYRKWANMLMRCEGSTSKRNIPSYEGVFCGEGFKHFSNFRKWAVSYEELYGVDINNCDLDKDILSGESKVYSSDTCCLIPRDLNVFLTERGAERGEYLLGVRKFRDSSNFQARCCNPFGKNFIKSFSTEMEAHKQWAFWKLEVLLQYTRQNITKDLRVIDALEKKYQNY